MGEQLRRRAAHLVGASLLVYACGGSDDVATGSTSANSSGSSGATNAGASGVTGAGGSAGSKAGAAGTGGSVAGTGGSAGAGNAAGKAGAGNAAGAAGVGNAAGAAGVGNAAGSSGSSGGAGSAGAPVAGCGKPNVCNPTSCGNGVIDSCMLCGDPFGGPGGAPPPPPPQGPGGGGGQCMTVSEGCDGADLGTSTCASLGYTGGTVACTSTCELDATGCETCAPGLGSCGIPSFVTSKHVVDVALSSDGSDANIAWIDAAGAHFAALDSQLAPLGLTGAFGSPNAQSIAVTPLVGGQSLVAVSAGGTVTLFRVDNGAATMVRSFSGSSPFFGTRPSGPLLAYVAPNGLLTTELSSAFGDQATTPKATFMAAELEFANAVFAVDHFIVAARGPMGATLVTVGIDGAIGAPTSPAGMSTEYPQVATDGATTRFTYSNFGNPPASGVYIQSLDGNGQPTSQPLALGVTPAQFNVAPLVQRGSKSVVLLGGYTGGTGIGKTLDLAVFDPPNALVSQPVARAPSIAHWDIAKRSTDVVMAWIARTGCSDQLWLARKGP